jgi:putative ABC transport system permease protein
VAIVVVAAGNVAYGQIHAHSQHTGADLIVITPRPTSRLTAQDAATLNRRAKLIGAVSPVIVEPTNVVGVATDYLSIRHWTLASGVPFDNDDVRAKRAYALLGRAVASRLFPDADPFGARVRLGGVSFTVVGVLAETDGDQDNVVVVPYTVAQGRFSEIVVTPAGHADVGAVEDELRGILRTAHQLRHGAPDDFTIQDQTTLVDNIQESR